MSYYNTLALLFLGLLNLSFVNSWVVTRTRRHSVGIAASTNDLRVIQQQQQKSHSLNSLSSNRLSSLRLQSATEAVNSVTSTKKKVIEELPYDYVIPEDSVIHIKPRAMIRLRELREQQMKKDNNNNNNNNEYLLLRMGVRSGGCSGMSYVMDFTTIDLIDNENDIIDTYEQDKIQCITDSKSMLYLYGLQLDYSTELIGGGFKFNNPNAEESCGCGSSFGV